VRIGFKKGGGAGLTVGILRSLSMLPAFAREESKLKIPEQFGNAGTRGGGASRKASVPPFAHNRVAGEGFINGKFLFNPEVLAESNGPGKTGPQRELETRTPLSSGRTKRGIFVNFQAEKSFFVILRTGPQPTVAFKRLANSGTRGRILFLCGSSVLSFARCATLDQRR